MKCQKIEMSILKFLGTSVTWLIRGIQFTVIENEDPQLEAAGKSEYLAFYPDNIFYC